MRNEKGITLLSLVITVTLMMILGAISIYTGIESYRDMKVQAFVIKMKALQEKVDILCDQYSVAEINAMSTDSPSDKAKIVLNEVISMGNLGKLKCWFAANGDGVETNYKYFSIRDIEEELQLKDFDVAVWINPATRNIIAVEGVKVDDIKYYRQYDLQGGQTLLEPVRDTNFLLEKGKDYFVQTYDNKAIIKFTKQYNTVSYTMENNGTRKTFSNVEEIELPYSGKYKIEVQDSAKVTKSVDGISVTIVNKPMLVDGMTPVKLNSTGDGWVNTTQDDPEWYNYDSSVKKWANVKLKDGSMYVWIPKYAYSLDSENQTISVKFLKEFSDITTCGKALDTGYKVMPAFENGINNEFSNGEWDNEITGFWVAKYEIINNSSKPQSICTVAEKSWRGITPVNAFKVCRMMEADYKSDYFGDSVSAASGTLEYAIYENDTNNIDTHLMKNSEWGAIAYLTWSNYGAGGEIADKTSYYINEQITAEYCSTKTNITGVYGLKGGAHDLVAAGMNLDGYYNSTNTSTKYATVYKEDIGTSIIYGDAMQETMNWGHYKYDFDSTGFRQLLCRGGYIKQLSNGVFAYHNKSYEGTDSVTFRPVIIVEY